MGRLLSRVRRLAFMAQRTRCCMHAALICCTLNIICEQTGAASRIVCCDAAN
jgi:hypothetical protein